MKCKTAVKVAKGATKKATAKKAATKKVTLTYHADKGKAVYVAGSFNGWKPNDKKMTFKGGIYSTSLALEAGTYEYKFVVDGVWSIDPENAASVPNDQGTFNSVLTVK